MPTTLTSDNDVLVLDVRGVLRKDDLDRAQKQLLEVMDREGSTSVRLLVRLDDFEGWEPDPQWDDMSFPVAHGDALSKIAIVGDPRWRAEALMFAAADLRKGPVQFYPPALEPDARAWLAS